MYVKSLFVIYSYVELSYYTYRPNRIRPICKPVLYIYSLSVM